MSERSVTALASMVAASAACGSLLTYYMLTKQQQQGDDWNNNDLKRQSTLEIIKKRRSVFPKQYTGEPVAREVIDAMLEAARWAPTHHLTEPWHFIVYSGESLMTVGKFLAEDYKEKATASRKFFEKKYEKKLKNAKASSYIVALCFNRDPKARCPEVEEICSVAMAVQNMHLVGTEMGVGSYWSSASVYDPEEKKNRAIVNSSAIRDFLKLGPTQTCLGWLFVGSCDEKCFKPGLRKPIADKVVWK